MEMSATELDPNPAVHTENLIQLEINENQATRQPTSNVICQPSFSCANINIILVVIWSTQLLKIKGKGKGNGPASQVYTPYCCIGVSEDSGFNPVSEKPNKLEPESWNDGDL